MTTDHSTQDTFRQELARLLLDSSGIEEPEGTQDFLQLTAGAAALHAATNALLHSAVASTRAAGATWQSIGDVLGMSKQAAQKRFAPTSLSCGTKLDPRERIIGPTTYFDELRELGLAGQYGWHSIEAGPTHHRVVSSETQWEHARITVSPARVARLQAEGWDVIGSSFPYTYLKRDTGVPCLHEPREPSIWYAGR